MKTILIKSFADKPWRSPATYQMIEESLRERWPVEVLIPQSEQGLREKLLSQWQQTRQAFVFNIAEFIDEEQQRGFIPAMLDEIGIPHVGSDAAAIATGLNKAATKKKLQENGIPTPDYFVYHSEETSSLQEADEIGFPLFAKPLNAGGHLGVSEDSIIQSAQDLPAVVKALQQEHHQPVLVEAYIDDDHMREFSVGIVGNDPYLFTPVEIDFDAMPVEENILSFDAAQKDLEVIQPVQEEEMCAALNALSLQTFNAVGAKDYSRIDLRMDQDACYVLEINTMPGLGPHSFLPEAMRDQHGLDYPQFIQKLVEVAIQG